MTKGEKEKQKRTKIEELHKVESAEVKQTRELLKEAVINSSNVYDVRKGIVSGSNVQQVRTGIDRMIGAAGVQQVRSQIEQPKTQQKEKPQNQK